MILIVLHWVVLLVVVIATAPRMLVELRIGLVVTNVKAVIVPDHVLIIQLWAQI